MHRDPSDIASVLQGHVENKNCSTKELNKF